MMKNNKPSCTDYSALEHGSQDDLIKLVSRFRNGEHRFNNDPFFNVAIRALLQGTDPIDVLDSVLEARYDTQQVLNKIAGA